ncbi:hypothetical protein AB5J56_31600 [Streptomyces sp. R21]|uniref:Uncharacterized protein n=1 Tax=Streptomyces sp. R21 TaxID=3238627 RepID=A0AB39PGL4_9ACTN
MTAADGIAAGEAPRDLDMADLASGWELTCAVLLPWTGAAPPRDGSRVAAEPSRTGAE